MSVAAIGIGAGVLIGGYQAIQGAANAKRAQKKLENQTTPVTSPNKAINDYYQAALGRATAGPYNSLSYQNNKQGILQNQAAALGALSDRRAGVQNAGAIVQQTNNSLMRAGAAAEAEQDRRFQQWGQATGAKAADDKYVFGINSMLPYNKQRELYGLQASGGAQLENAGLENIGSGLNNLGTYFTAMNQYGNPKPPKKPKGSSSSSSGNSTGGGF